ncbi:MAG: phosphoglucomutase/phosphomannomutase family protein, partial [Candidatus Omnitrophota bacterium]|nr:phosphoglucomutase/phosphomannomutase family protein [Candidatus Omnitrophota bacterium]
MCNTVSQIKFGTDGWRAIIADTYTLENVKILTQGVADYLGSGKKAAVGYDTRFMSGKFAEAAASVLRNNGIEVVLSDRPTPTPALSFAVKSRKLDLGIMITASHNPAEYNGFKIKNSSGGGASEEMTREVEGLLGKTSVKDGALVEPIKAVDIIKDYI